jgi:hypothetical protein
LSKKYKDYFHFWNGSKNFLISADSGKIIYHISILDSTKNDCDLCIETISIKFNEKRNWYSHSDRKNPQILNAIKIFEVSILPKIKDKLLSTKENDIEK